jgi:alpha-tubulin suppressor-like RCC1 family protein
MWGTSPKVSTIPQNMLSGSVNKTSGMFSGKDTVIDHPMMLSLDSSECDFKLGDISRVFCGATGTAFLSTDGKCFVLGSNKNGELGWVLVAIYTSSNHMTWASSRESSERVYFVLLCNRIGETKEVPKPTLLSIPVPVQKASLGENFSALLTTEGDIYTFGYGGSLVNGMGMLGHGSMDSFKTPKLVESLIEDGCYASDVHVGEYSMTVLTTEGEVLTCGSGSYGRLGNVETTDQLYLEPVELMGAEETVQIAGGHAFSLALNTGGIIHSWGRNNEGQLGTGMGMAVDAYSMESIPQPIEGDLEGRKVSRVAAGHSHAAAVTVDGELFTWGMNSTHEPKLESSLLHTKIVDVACGKNYTLALDEGGRVHAMGNGKTGVLGLASTKYSAFPVLVEGIPAEERVVHMSCGHAHVACVTELKNK